MSKIIELTALLAAIGISFALGMIYNKIISNKPTHDIYDISDMD